MKKLITFSALATLGLFLGCAKESPHGGPGAFPARNEAVRNPEPVYPPGDTRDSSRTFTVSVPSAKTGVTQGDVEEITIGINRGSNFDETVRLKVRAPAGLSVTPAVTNVPRDMNEVKMAVSAAPDAPIGKAAIEVVGTPETGPAVAVHMDVDVKRR